MFSQKFLCLKLFVQETAQDISSGFDCPESINCETSFSWSQCLVSCLCVQICPQNDSIKHPVVGERFHSIREPKGCQREGHSSHFGLPYFFTRDQQSIESGHVQNTRRCPQPFVPVGGSLLIQFLSCEFKSIYLNFSRFFTVHAEELSDLMQICYRVEQAHWYYKKWYSLDLTQNGLLSEASLKPCSFKEVLVNFLSVKFN